MKEAIPTGAEYYILELLPSSQPNDEALAKFCDETQQFVFDFLAKYCSLRLLINLILHSNKGKVLVANYLIAHSDKLDRYDCSNLEEYVVDGQFYGLVSLYGAVISLKDTCGSLLTNNNAEQQLERIVAKYRYADQKYFDEYAHDRTFYLYFQKEALPTDKKLSYHARFGWVIRDFTRRRDIEICASQWDSFLQEAIYHYDSIKNRLENSEGLAAFLFTNARKKGLYITLESLYSDNKITLTFKKDLLPSLLYNLLMRCQIKNLDYDYTVIRLGMDEPLLLNPRTIYLYPRTKLYRFVDLDGNRVWGDLCKISGFESQFFRLSLEVKLLDAEYTRKLVQNILLFIAKAGDANGIYDDTDLARDLREIVEPMIELLSPEDVVKYFIRFIEAPEQQFASKIADAIHTLIAAKNADAANQILEYLEKQPPVCAASQGMI